MRFAQMGVNVAAVTPSWSLSRSLWVYPERSQQKLPSGHLWQCVVLPHTHTHRRPDSLTAWLTDRWTNTHLHLMLKCSQRVSVGGLNGGGLVWWEIISLKQPDVLCYGLTAHKNSSRSWVPPSRKKRNPSLRKSSVKEIESSSVGPACRPDEQSDSWLP